MKEYQNVDALLLDYPIQKQLDELVSHLSAQGWSTEFLSFVIEPDRSGGFALYCQIYKGLYAEYISEDGQTLDDRVHIVLLNKEDDYDWIDWFNLTDSKGRAYDKADDLEDKIYNRYIKDAETIGCDIYHEQKENQ